MEFSNFLYWITSWEKEETYSEEEIRKIIVWIDAILTLRMVTA